MEPVVDSQRPLRCADNPNRHRRLRVATRQSKWIANGDCPLADEQIIRIAPLNRLERLERSASPAFVYRDSVNL